MTLSPAAVAASAVCGPIATTTGGATGPNAVTQARAADPLLYALRRYGRFAPDPPR